MPLTGTADAALQPLRDALRRSAEVEAERILGEAREAAARIAAEAQEEAARMRRAAAARGEADARADARARSSRARRVSREAILRAQEELRGQLLREVRLAAVDARIDPRYPALLERLRHQAAEVLGPGAVVRESPDGGIIAESGTRRLDLSLPFLASRQLDQMAEEVSALWSE